MCPADFGFISRGKYRLKHRAKAGESGRNGRVGDRHGGGTDRHKTATLRDFAANDQRDYAIKARQQLGLVAPPPPCADSAQTLAGRTQLGRGARTAPGSSSPNLLAKPTARPPSYRQLTFRRDFKNIPNLPPLADCVPIFRDLDLLFVSIAEIRGHTGSDFASLPRFAAILPIASFCRRLAISTR